MSTPTAALKAQFDLQTRLFNNTLEGVSESEANTRENEHVNNMKFIAGHILNTRVNFLTRITGGVPDESYMPLYGRGVKLNPDAQYPALSEITEKWKATASQLSEALNNVPEETLAAPSPVQAPVADDTIRGLIAFLISHESYHIGQLGLLRKMIGKEAMSYN